MLTWLFDNTSAFRWGVALLSMVVISLMQGLVMRWQAHGDALASHRQRVPDWGSCSSGNRHRIGATESGDDHDQVLDAHVGQFEESKTAKAVVVVNH
jgi:hypothetical protein